MVQSWSDTQVVALVGAGALSGTAVVLQGGVMSNAVSFTVNTLQIASVSPMSGAPGTAVTITGTGFGNSQGSGTVLLGSATGQVVSWSDTQVVAAVASNSVSGVVRVGQNGSWSNAISFTVSRTGGSGSAAMVVPNVLNLAVGDTHTIEGLNSAGQVVTGLSWTSSDPSVVSLSTDDPPVLTAVSPGHVTIVAGTASADVTVWAGGVAAGDGDLVEPGRWFRCQ